MESHLTILDLRAKIPNDTFTSRELNELLVGYSNKRMKIASMLHRHEIIRIRRGLYTFPAILRKSMLSIGVLANQLYGPSYVSEDFALSYYGLIPETVTRITSITTGRSRHFDTAFGHFAYRYCQTQAYPLGITISGPPKQQFLIATPEKALFDKILHDKRFDGNHVEEYLFDDLRLDEEAFSQLSQEHLQALIPHLPARLNKLSTFLENL